MPKSARPSVVWFKRDLRTVDHAPLAEAAARGPVIPLLIIEPDLWREPDAAHRHYAFMAECAAELDAALVRLGARLIVRVGPAVSVLADLRERSGFETLWSHEETGNLASYRRDLAVAAWCREQGVAWHEYPQTGVVRRLKSRDGWAKRWDRMMAKPIIPEPTQLSSVLNIEPQALPGAGPLGLAVDGCTERQIGGRAQALDTLATFLDHRGQDYRRAMSNPLAGAGSCSRLSPHLAWGTLSMREASQATNTRLLALRGQTSAEARALRGSLVSFAGRLHWHCHFMQKLETDPDIEQREFHPAAVGLRDRPADPALLAAWSRGNTGYPFVDACMRALRETGWMNFRMRAMLVSFASYNLWLPWQETGLVLARLFTDYEPGIHWPQMQMQSGTTGINTIRLYNPIKQGYDQDPEGRFVRRWIPELAAVPDPFLQEPWRWPDAPAILGSVYPSRVVDLTASSAAAKDRIFAARRAAGFRDAADAIQARHGSRKSGIPMRGRDRRAPSKARPSSQLEFDL